jgi:hypothetical protein
MLAAALFVLIALGGCERSDPRIKKSINALDWAGGSAEDRRVRDALRSALEKADAASLAKPELVTVSVYIGKGDWNGTLHADWIGAKPSADALRILLPDGKSFDFPFDPLYVKSNQEASATLLFYSAHIFNQKVQPAGWVDMLTGNHARAVLLEGSRIVSNEVPLFAWTPAPTTSVADSGKLIGTVDASGNMSIYCLTHAVKAGDAFASGDVYQVAFNAGNTAAAGVDPDGYLDKRGPGAFVGRRFLESRTANEPLNTNMFGTAATSPAAAAPATSRTNGKGEMPGGTGGG